MWWAFTLWAWTVAQVRSCYVHAVFSRRDSLSLLNTWRPLLVNSLEAKNQFYKAKVVLKTPGSFALCTTDAGFSMFVCRAIGDDHCVLATLWTSTCPVERMQVADSIKSWHMEAFPERSLRVPPLH